MFNYDRHPATYLYGFVFQLYLIVSVINRVVSCVVCVFQHGLTIALLYLVSHETRTLVRAVPIGFIQFRIVVSRAEQLDFERRDNRQLCCRERRFEDRSHPAAQELRVHATRLANRPHRSANFKGR